MADSDDPLAALEWLNEDQIAAFARETQKLITELEQRLRLLNQVLAVKQAWRAEMGDARAMVPVPEAHLGPEAPPPEGKTAGVLRLLGRDPFRSWTPGQLRSEMVNNGWMSAEQGDFDSLTATLSRMVAAGQIDRPRRGSYKLAPGQQPAEPQK